MIIANISPAFNNDVKQLIQKAVDKVNTTFHRHIENDLYVDIVINPRKSNILATASNVNPVYSIITFDAALMSKIDIGKHDDILTEIMLHELSHVVVPLMYHTNNPHGKEFKRVMRLLGYHNAGAKIKIPDELMVNLPKSKTKTRYIFVNDNNEEFPLTKKWLVLSQKGIQLSINGQNIKFSREVKIK